MTWQNLTPSGGFERKDDVDDAWVWLLQLKPPGVRFEWKWLIEIFIWETHVTPPAKHGMISSANCLPYEAPDIFQCFDHPTASKVVQGSCKVRFRPLNFKFLFC